MWLELMCVALRMEVLVGVTQYKYLNVKFYSARLQDKKGMGDVIWWRNVDHRTNWYCLKIEDSSTVEYTVEYPAASELSESHYIRTSAYSLHGFPLLLWL